MENKKKVPKSIKDVVKLHQFYRGKIQIMPKCEIKNFADFSLWYTPGVAEPSKIISKDKNWVYELTNKWNTVAIVSDGSRVLGLGDVGPEASLPVMEGKALLFKYLGGVDAFPICLNSKEPDKIIQTVELLQPSFGGINLEDIAKPGCFYILNKLKEKLNIPVWHDDQQGTATVTLAGLINALKLVDKKIKEVLICLIGAGAANIAIAKLLIKAGVKAGNIIMVDSKGILHPDRKELKNDFQKWEMCLMTNAERRKGGIAEAMKGMDVCIACSKPEPGTIKREWASAMSKDSILFACANPLPEIWPEEAKRAGVRIVATGRSDFPNQINNSLGFPGIFRGVLDVRARVITDEMCIAAADELARYAQEKGLNENYIIPRMDEWEVFPREAAAVGRKAIKQKVAEVDFTYDSLYKKAYSIIKKSREALEILMSSEIIPPW